MFWEQIGFFVFTAGYLMLSSVKTIDQFRAQIEKVRKQKYEKKIRLRKMASNKIAPSPDLATDSIQDWWEETEEEKLKRIKKETNLRRYQFVKTLINYSMSFNSAFLIVGSLSEAYLYGVRMVGNIISVSLGYVYAFFIVMPFIYSLDDDIQTPFDYFAKRFRNSKLVRAIVTSVAMFFYWFFLTLYLWGSSVLLTTLIPRSPLYLSSIILGAFSIIGGVIGGFTQSTKTSKTI
jgi:hypothetical protein